MNRIESNMREQKQRENWLPDGLAGDQPGLPAHRDLPDDVGRHRQQANRQI